MCQPPPTPLFKLMQTKYKSRLTKFIRYDQFPGAASWHTKFRLKNCTITHKPVYFVVPNRDTIFYLNNLRRERDRRLRRTWKRSAWKCRKAQRTKLISSPVITLIGKRWNDFSLGIILISGWKYKKQKKIIIFLTSYWCRSTKQSCVRPVVRLLYIMLDKYLKGGLFHPAEPFQLTDETETAATGKELKCE